MVVKAENSVIGSPVKVVTPDINNKYGSFETRRFMEKEQSFKNIDLSDMNTTIGPEFNGLLYQSKAGSLRDFFKKAVRSLSFSDKTPAVSDKSPEVNRAIVDHFSNAYFKTIAQVNSVVITVMKSKDQTVARHQPLKFNSQAIQVSLNDDLSKNGNKDPVSLNSLIIERISNFNQKPDSFQLYYLSNVEEKLKASVKLEYPVNFFEMNIKLETWINEKFPSGNKVEGAKANAKLEVGKQLSRPPKMQPLPKKQPAVEERRRKIPSVWLDSPPAQNITKNPSGQSFYSSEPRGSVDAEGNMYPRDLDSSSSRSRNYFKRPPRDPMLPLNPVSEHKYTRGPTGDILPKRNQPNPDGEKTMVITPQTNGTSPMQEKVGTRVKRRFELLQYSGIPDQLDFQKALQSLNQMSSGNSSGTNSEQ